jgi:hypothetical protein
MILPEDKKFYSLSSLVLAAWTEAVRTVNDFDVVAKDASIPLKMTIECSVEMNPDCKYVPMVHHLKVPSDSSPLVKIEIPNLLGLQKSQV